MEWSFSFEHYDGNASENKTFFVNHFRPNIIMNENLHMRVAGVCFSNAC